MKNNNVVIEKLITKWNSAAEWDQRTALRSFAACRSDLKLFDCGGPENLNASQIAEVWAGHSGGFPGGVENWLPKAALRQLVSKL